MARKPQQQIPPAAAESQKKQHPVPPTLLRVRLTPRGGRDALMRYEGEILYARVAATPVDGAANRALIELIAATLGIPKSRVSFDSGETARAKVLRIDGLTEPLLLKCLEEAIRLATNQDLKQNLKAVE